MKYKSKFSLHVEMVVLLFDKKPDSYVNVKVELGEITTKGDIHSKENIYIGGLVDGDEMDIASLLEKRSVSQGIRWFALSAITATNDIVYFVYLPHMKMGWHFYRKKDSSKSMMVKYIGNDNYCELAKLLLTCITENRDEFSYRETLLNDAAFALERNDLQGAFQQLIILVRDVKELSKPEILYVLYNAYLMLHQLKCSQEIEPNYFMRNLTVECDFIDKYKMLLGKENPDWMMRQYLQDIIKLVEEDKKVSLDFWLRNIEVYIANQSSIANPASLRGYLRNTIPPLVSGEIQEKNGL